mmetsp:Transcript_1033/g.1928  ORF Transcript_1033/g.1928 Transcript_1033/m.1928 type:complete len:227 (+) Transcript_1033:968-1648(+)
MKKMSKFMDSWYPAKAVTPNVMALLCMFKKPAILVRVIARRGPVNSPREASSDFFGMRRPGSSCFFRRAATIQKELINVAHVVAAAAPPHPPLIGQTQNNASPTTFATAAHEMIFNGVITSRVTTNRERQTFWAIAAQAVAPRQWIYDVADVRSSGSTFSSCRRAGVRNAYINVKAAPQTNDTVRAGDAASLAASTLPAPPDEFEAYAREASPVVARLRKENKYNA